MSDEPEEFGEKLSDEHGELTLRGLFVAPTEPPRLKALGKSSSLPEQFGCDVLWFAHGNRYGIQRKEWRDLLASVADGRLTKEVGQMHSAAVRGVLCIEGKVSWTTEGELVTGYGERWSRERWWGVELAVQLEGVWVVHTSSLHDTARFVTTFNLWSKKKAHGSLSARPGPKGMWGTKATDREYAKHVLTGFPGIGPGNADKIYEHFGRAPLKWDCTEEEMLQVPGMGKKKVAQMWKALS